MLAVACQPPLLHGLPVRCSTCVPTQSFVTCMWAPGLPQTMQLVDVQETVNQSVTARVVIYTGCLVRKCGVTRACTASPAAFINCGLITASHAYCRCQALADNRPAPDRFNFLSAHCCGFNAMMM